VLTGGSANVYTANYSNGSTFVLHSNPSANYTCRISGITFDTSKTYIITLINMNASTAKFYCSSVIVENYNNNLAIQNFFYNGGSANISTTISSASVITQQIAIFNTSSTNYAISNISAFYT
jgi:hypothetical protein